MKSAVIWPLKPAFRMRLIRVSSWFHPCSVATWGRYVPENCLPFLIKMLKTVTVERSCLRIEADLDAVIFQSPIVRVRAFLEVGK